MKKILCMLLAFAMVLGIMMPMATFAESTESTDKTVYADGKVWFDLNGNSKLFINTEADDYADCFTMEFLPGVDYSGFVAKPTGDFATDKAAIAFLSAEAAQGGGAAMPYTTNKNPANPTVSTPADFTTDADGNYWYTFEENTYLVRPTENVIKVVSSAVDTSNIADEEIKARYASLKEGTTIDVPDGKYKKFGFLMAARFRYSKSIEVQFKYKEDAEAEKVTVDSLNFGTTAADLYFKPLDADATSAIVYNCQHGFTRIEIETNQEKTLESIHIKDSGAKNVKWSGIVFSAWGEEQTLEEKITVLETLNATDITTTDSYNAVKEAVEDIEKYLVNYGVLLSAEQENVYNTAKNKMTAYENAIKQEKLYTQNKEWFDLNGNSKLFMDKNSADYTNRANLTNYLPGVDYTGYLATPSGVFATDTGAVTNSNLSIFTYTVDKSSETNSLSAKYTDPADFKTGEDGKLYFVYKDVPYRVDPTKNVIKSLSKDITTTKLTNPEDIARHQSLKTGVTMDIPDGYYKNIGFLTAVRNAYTKTFRLELYYEGEETPVTSDHKQTPPKTSSGGYAYDIYFHTLTGTGGSTSGYFFTPWNIEVDSSKKLEKIRVYDSGLNNVAWPIHIISSWGDEITLAERFTKLNTLNETGVTDENYQQVKEAVEEIEAVMAKTSADSSVLKAADKAIYDSAKANLATYEVTFKNANDNLVVKSELEFKGNSKLFMDSTSEDFANKLTLTNYYPGLDYAGLVKQPKGDFAEDFAGADNTFGDFLACFGYTINKGTKPAAGTSIPDFTTGENGKVYWNVNDVDYMVRPTEKTIKLSEGVSLSGIKDAEIKAKYATLQEYTFDVPKGKYNTLTFLAGIVGKETYHRDANVTLIYEDGTTGEGTFNVISTAVQSLTWAKGGVSFPRMISSTAAVWTRDYHTFAPYTVEADETKVLKAVKLTAVERSATNAYKYPIYIVSISGSHTIKEILSAVSSETSKEDAQVILDAVNKTLADNDITADDLTDETKAKYFVAKACANTLEIVSTGYEASKVTVEYTTGVDTSAKVIVAEYENGEEVLNTVKIFAAEFTANETTKEFSYEATTDNVKVFVWKDMINFFPYSR